MKLLVTGATGKFGTKAMSHLLTKVSADDIIVSVRDTNKAEALREKGVTVRQGDFDAPDQLIQTFEGADKMLLISTDGDNETRIRQHANAINAAKAAGVKHIVYTSLANAQESQLFLAPVHQFTENAIIESGLTYTFLRNNWYLENELGSIEGVKNGQPWLIVAQTGKVGWMPQVDYAEAAANVLAGQGHDNKIYELSGELLTTEELAKRYAKATGRDVSTQVVDIDTYDKIMTEAGLPPYVVNMVVQIQKDIEAGTLEIESKDIDQLLDRPRTALEEALKLL